MAQRNFWGDTEVPNNDCAGGSMGLGHLPKLTVHFQWIQFLYIQNKTDKRENSRANIQLWTESFMESLSSSIEESPLQYSRLKYVYPNTK